MNNKIAAAILVSTALLASFTTSAQTIGQASAVSGSLRAGYWSSDRNFDDALHFPAASLWLALRAMPIQDWSVTAEAWTTLERGDGFALVRAELREVSATRQFGALDLSLGRRVISWGRADRINPTDLIAPRDYRRLFPDDDDLRLGVTTIWATWGHGNYALAGYWLPEFRPSRFPDPKMSDVQFAGYSDRLEAGQYALRFDQTGGGAVDWSISWSDIISRIGEYEVQTQAPLPLWVSRRYPRVRTLGADFATSSGPWTGRGEIAFTTPVANDQASTQFRPSAFAVIGGDRRITEELSLGLQYLFHQTFGFHGPPVPPNGPAAALAIASAQFNNQLRATQHGISGRFAYQTPDGTLLGELGAAGYFTDGSWVILPKIKYSLSDTMIVVVGANIFAGPTVSFFGGPLRKNTAAFVELRYGL